MLTNLDKRQAGDVVAIWGLGPIGLLCARWCQIRNAGTIIGIDCVPERLQLAQNVLKINTINFTERNTVKELLEAYPYGIDVAIEAAGFEYATTWRHKIERAINLETDTADLFDEMFTAVRPFGKVGPPFRLTIPE